MPLDDEVEGIAVRSSNSAVTGHVTTVTGRTVLLGSGPSTSHAASIPGPAATIGRPRRTAVGSPILRSRTRPTQAPPALGGTAEQ